MSRVKREAVQHTRVSAVCILAQDGRRQGHGWGGERNGGEEGQERQDVVVVSDDVTVLFQVAQQNGQKTVLVAGIQHIAVVCSFQHLDE